MNEQQHTALYARVSTEELARGESIATQLQALHAEAAKHPEPVIEYVDEGISAKSVKKRPQMVALLENVRSGRVKRILVTKTARIWRNTKEALETVELLDQTRTGFIPIHQHVDLNTPSGRNVFRIMCSIDEAEREEVGDRVRRVKHKMAADGVWVAGNPYGYRRNPDTKRLEIVPDQAAVVREIYRLYVEEEWGHNRIAKHLNRSGLRKPSGSMWQGTTVAIVLRNPAYRGDSIYNRQVSHDHDWHKLDHHPDWIAVEGTHEPIVDPEVWDLAHAMNKARTGPGRPQGIKHPFSSILRCNYCDSIMYAKGVKGRPKYFCSRYLRLGSAACKGVMIDSGILDDALTELLDENIDRVRVSGFQKVDRPVPEKGREFWEEFLARTKTLYQEQVIDLEQMKRDIARGKEEIARLDARDASFPSDLRFREMMEDDAIPLAEKRRVIRDLVERISVNDHMIEVVYRTVGLVGWGICSELYRHRPLRDGNRLVVLPSSGKQLYFQKDIRTVEEEIAARRSDRRDIRTKLIPLQGLRMPMPTSHERLRPPKEGEWLVFTFDGQDPHYEPVEEAVVNVSGDRQNDPAG